MIVDCNVVFPIQTIHKTFQTEIIKKLLNSNLTCGTNIVDLVRNRTEIENDR